MKKIFLAVTLLGLMACSHKTTQTTDTGAAAGTTDHATPTAPTKVQLAPSGVMPKATAFKMSGDYANNVAITLDNAGNIIYYPAPTDISSYSAPMQLADGWWLNRQGIGPNSVFTTYTFEEYSKLPNVPSREQLKAAVIPGARVINMVELPMTIQEAASNADKANQFLKNL